MKKKPLIVFLALICVLFVFLSNCGNQVVYGISGGTYKMVTNTATAFAPAVSFDLTEGQCFQFTFDLLSSYLSVGSVTMNGHAVCKTDDGKFTYIFEVVDNDTLRFMAKDSSATVRVDGTTAVPDGALFKYVEGSWGK